MDFVLSLNQISKLVFANGMDKTYVIEGPMGSGKTSIINLAKEKFGDKYNYVVLTVEGAKLEWKAYSGDGTEVLDTYAIQK